MARKESFLAIPCHGFLKKCSGSGKKENNATQVGTRSQIHCSKYQYAFELFRLYVPAPIEVSSLMPGITEHGHTRKKDEAFFVDCPYFASLTFYGKRFSKNLMRIIRKPTVVSMEKHDGSRCLNCGKENEKQALFCSRCGQKTTIHRLDFHSLLHDVMHYFTHIERNIFALIGQLSSQPGSVVDEYIQGKRKKYFPPVNFFLVVAGILVLMVSLFDTFEVAFSAGNAVSAPKTDAPLLHFLNSKINWLFFFTTPLLALLFRIIFFRRKHNFFEHLAISFYAMGYLLLVFALVMVPAFALVNTLTAFEAMLWLFFSLACFYYAVTYFQPYHPKKIWAFFKMVFLSLIVFLILLAVVVVSIRIYYLVHR